VSIRHLEHLFRPASVAVVGASDRERSIGALVMRNLREGGFSGPVWPVNPRHATIAGQQAWPDVAALPEAPELAVVCTPAPTVPGIVAQLGARGTRAAVVLTAGLKAPAEGGGTLEQAMLAAARPHLLRILGPNCVGLLVPGIGLNASFAQASARHGPLAFVSQSGALATAMLDWANARGIGFSHFISMGDSADVDFGDVLDYLGSDPGTRAILMYIESISAARKFMSAARAAARNKPVIVVKAGRAPEGAKAAASHTGALAASDAVIDAAIRRAGMLRVDTLEDLFDAAETLARARPLRGHRLGMVTNGGGAGVLAADALSLAHGTLATLEDTTRQRLDACLPPTWSHGNPVDIIGDAPAQRYVEALAVLRDAPEIDALLFMHAPTAVVPRSDVAQAVVPLLREFPRPVLSCWLGADRSDPARRACEAAGLPTYDTPERAVTAFMHLVNYQRNQEVLTQAPPAAAEHFRADREAALAIVEAVLADGREMLTEPEAKALLAAYGIPVVATKIARDPDAVVAAAAEVGYPVVVKILSREISHKSDVGGVALDLKDEHEVRLAVRTMQRRVRELRPDAHLDGFTVQQMVLRPRAHELIAGVASDPVFGPVLLFGRGGTAVEVIRDRAVALPPLNATLAADLVSRTQVSRLLAGYRDRLPVDHAALYRALVQMSQLVCDLPQVVELDINPLLADDQGVIALDARVRVQLAGGEAAARLAIRPYPTELESWIEVADTPLMLRPIRPEDEARLRDFYAEADPQDLRLRFFSSRREVPRSELARYSQIDYDREMTFVAIDGHGGLVGEVRAACDPDNREAEFAIQVRRDWQGRGLGRLLLERMIGYLAQRGTGRLVGVCLRENDAMAALARCLGFTIEADADRKAVRLSLDLQRAG
jgi:Acyl-CoA synthetase (NDP forming)